MALSPKFANVTVNAEADAIARLLWLLLEAA